MFAPLYPHILTITEISESDFDVKCWILKWNNFVCYSDICDMVSRTQSNVSYFGNPITCWFE